ncbi:MAG: class I SAM-dependent methyltransferase, partial [Thermoanaerobaculia bacterium]
AYERVNWMMSEEKRSLIDESYVEALLELVPGLRARLDVGATVLDAGCGDGTVLTTMARMFPRSAFRGYDLSREAIRRATEDAEALGLPNVEFEVGDIASLDEPRAYDLVLALEAVRELAFPRLVLRNLAAALKRDGVLILQELAASSHLNRNLGNTFAPMLYAISCMHAVPVAASQEGEALGAMWGKEKALQLLAEAGFAKVRFETIASDPLSYYGVATK